MTKGKSKTKRATRRVDCGIQVAIGTCTLRSCCMHHPAKYIKYIDLPAPVLSHISPPPLKLPSSTWVMASPNSDYKLSHRSTGDYQPPLTTADL